MRHVAFIVPGSIGTRSGGYEYDRRMIAGLRSAGWTVDVREGGLASLRAGARAVVDSLAFDALAPEMERESKRLQIVALVHMPRVYDSPDLEPLERRALSAASLVVVTGRAAVVDMSLYGVDPARIVVIEPGTDDAPLARGSGGPAVHVVCVAAVTRGKGHDTLVRALSRIPRHLWRLTCGGRLDAEPANAERLRHTIDRERVGNRVVLAGELEDGAVAALYDSADLFALATLHETYGMAVAEALARGLPIVSTTTGAIPELVGVDAGLLVPPGQFDPFARALAAAITDSALRGRLAAGARGARTRLRSWDAAVGDMAAALDRLGPARR